MRVFSYALVIPVFLSACAEYSFEKLPEDTAVLPDIPTVQPKPEPEPEEPEPPEPQLPIAECEVSPNPVSPPFETADFQGVHSHDPSGLDITAYQWTLVRKPAGSAATMPNGTGPNREGFMPDLAGDYVAELVVMNEDSVLSEPCQVTLQAIPAESLWVELYWANGGDDMDLHLVRNGGDLNSNNDCHYNNCTGPYPNWGANGASIDDPALDLDDIAGRGPENVNIGEPNDSTYRVAVKDYKFSGQQFQGANPTTVNVYVDGALAWTETRDIVGEGDTVWFVEIDWANGTFTRL
jgi:hypothetical protein